MVNPGDDVEFLETSGIGKTWKHIDKVRDSYNTGFGVVAEPVQNSIDAIRQFDDEFGSTKHELKIAIDPDNRAFVIKDDGLGMDIESAPEYASPNETDKTFISSTIGEMGVGFTYLTFSTNELIVETLSKRPDSDGQSGYIKYRVEDAHEWFTKYEDVEDPDLEEMKESMPTASVLDVNEMADDDVDAEDTYTKITAKDVQPVPIVGPNDGSNDETAGTVFFDFSVERLRHYFRTETAIGSTRTLIGREDVEDVSTSVWIDDVSDAFDSLDSNDAHSIEYEYASPDQYWDERGIIDLTEDGALEERFEDVHDHETVTLRDQITVMDDSSKEQIFSKRPWVLYDTVENRGTDDLFYYAVFLPDRDMFDDIADMIDDLDSWEISSGIFVGTKGMPTSEEVPTPSRTAEAGYWSNTFILFNYDSIDYDYGRKAASSKTRGMFRDIAVDIFNEFREFTQFASTDIESPVDPNEELSELASVDDIKSDEIPWKKEPNKQEGSVMMIFSELVSEGTLGNYQGWRSGLKTTYDWLGKYTGDTEFKDEILTIEFKPHTRNIAQDHKEGVKKVNQVDIVVAWDIDEDVLENEYSWNVEDVDDSTNTIYQGVNYRISKAAIQCQVIALSDLIDSM